MSHTWIVMMKSPETDEELAALRVSGAVTPHDATIAILPYDPKWPLQYACEEAKIRTALGDAVVVLEHVGSTSIPSMPAKPIIDILLAVKDSASEDTYVPALTAQGYRLHLRERAWEEHRLMKGSNPDVNLHVFTTGSNEITRMLAFRDRCRANPDEHELYERTKTELTRQVWRHVQHYANAKGDVVEAIISRALPDL